MDRSTPSFNPMLAPSITVVLLASERTSNVTGANYIIDGGLIKTT